MSHAELSFVAVVMGSDEDFWLKFNDDVSKNDSNENNRSMYTKFSTLMEQYYWRYLKVMFKNERTIFCEINTH
jgi:hypothetical protein